MNRFFLVGCPRSGTTLLQSLLVARGDVLSLPETDYAAGVVSRGGRRRYLGIAHREASAAVARLNQHAPGETTTAPLLPLARPYLRKFVAHLDAFARASGYPSWLEKTPRHLHYIEELAKAAPDACFLHIVRSAAPTVASLVEVTRQNPERWGGARTPEDCLERWIHDVAITRRYSSHARHVLVSYERLVEHPGTVLSRLFTELGLDAEDQRMRDVLTRYASAAERVRRPDETWKADVGGDIRNRNDGKVRKVLSDSQLAAVEAAQAEVGLNAMPFV